MESIVLYSRVSTSDQDFDSQVQDLKKWVTANNFKVVKSFGETASGYDLNAERKEYDNMKEYVLNNNIKHIAIWEISRLSRSMVKMITEVEFFTKHQVNIHFKKEGLESLSDNTTNKLLLQILGAVAELERNTMQDRMARGRMSSIMNGKAVFLSVLPYGYTKDEDGKLIVDEEEAKVVRMMFDLAIKGTTLYQIAQKLNSLGIQTRFHKQGRKRTLSNGNKIEVAWRQKTIAQTLHRTLYKGIRTYKGITIPVPAIVSEEMWNKVQDRFAENIGYINHTKYEYLFKGKIRCGKCNRTFVTYTLKSRTKDEGFYFCSGLNDPNKCSNGNNIAVKLVDKYLFVSLFNHPSVSDKVASDKLLESKNVQLEKQITYYKDEIKKAESKKARYVKLFADGYIDENDFKKEQYTIKNIVIDFENKIKSCESELTYPEDLDISDLLTAVYKSTDYNVKREFIDKYIDKILINYVKSTNINWEKNIQGNEKIAYLRLWAFNYPEPIHIVMTTRTKQCNIYTVGTVILDAAGDTLTIQ